ncbi:MAG: hypothetical protein M3R06_00495 [Chloroflexota bacterium]|nr:hypothetical protein [Chloroflexota bacterium]
MSAPQLPVAFPRLSLLIAEALVQRQSPGQITARALRLGLPRGLAQAMLAACCATSVDRAPRAGASQWPPVST